MAISTIDGLVAALPGTIQPYSKPGFSSQANGAWTSTFCVAGIPGAAANPSSGVAGDIPTDATAGAMPFTNPSNPALSYLGRFAGYGFTVGALLLYDRLWQNSGLSATSTSPQTVQSSPPVAVPLTRPDANGANVEAWWHVYATMGSGTPTVTLTYTDQDGNTGASGSSGALATTMSTHRTGPFTLASGDTGVRSIQTWQASATFTSGTIGLVQRRYIASIPIPVTGAGGNMDGIQAGLPRIYDDACLELVWFGVSGTVTVGGHVVIAQG